MRLLRPEGSGGFGSWEDESHLAGHLTALGELFSMVYTDLTAAGIHRGSSDRPSDLSSRREKAPIRGGAGRRKYRRAWSLSLGTVEACIGLLRKGVAMTAGSIFGVQAGLESSCRTR